MWLYDISLQTEPVSSNHLEDSTGFFGFRIYSVTQELTIMPETEKNIVAVFKTKTTQNPVPKPSEPTMYAGSILNGR